MPITKLISGGQTGADRGALEAAIYCKVPHGGWCPKGRKAEDGTIPATYLLQETSSADYENRTEANVVDSDATVVFTNGPATDGSLATINLAKKHGKPCLHISVDECSRKEAVHRIKLWFEGDLDEPPPHDCVLNVAGNRESKADGLQELVMAIMVDVFRELNPECGKLYPLG